MVQKKLVLFTLVSAALLLVIPAVGMQSGDASAKATDKDKASKKAETTTPPSAQEIANAKSQGLVWVNLGTRVYHKDGESYGKTKRGKFMTENEANKEGFHEAKQPPPSKKTGNKKKRDQSGIDATIDTHSSTPPKP
jgi:hypothetical protein